MKYFLPDEVDFIGLDFSKEALERLHEKFPNANTVKHPLQSRLPFKDNVFDRVVSNNVLYTLKKEEWEFTVSEIKRVSKPNAIIVISNLNYGFNASKIYFDHIRKKIQEIGYIPTFLHLASLSYPTIQIMRYNKIIKANNTTGNYSFINQWFGKKLGGDFTEVKDCLVCIINFYHLLAKPIH